MPLSAASKCQVTPERAEHAQLNFDWLVPFQFKQLLTPAEAGACIARSENYVRALVEAGRLESFADSALGERKSLLITRRSVVVYLAKIAQLDPDHYVDQVIEAAERMSTAARQKVVNALLKTLRKPL